MTHKHLLLGLSAIVSMAMPASAFALYVDPYDAQAGGGFPFQYNARHAQDAVDYQNWVYDQRRERTDVPTTSRIVYQPNTVRGTVLPDGVRTDDPTDRTDGDVDPTVGRTIIRRIEPPIIRTVFRDSHLPQTGPETVMGGLALLAAAGYTLWKSRSKEQLA